MGELESHLVLVLAAVALAATARRVGAPYPVFLAVGGAFHRVEEALDWLEMAGGG
jgi:hypothetical protein